MKTLLRLAAAFSWITLSSIGKAQETPPLKPAAAPLKDLPLELTLMQRSTKVVPGMSDKMQLTIDDITANQVIVSLAHKDHGMLIMPSSFLPDQSRNFKVGETEYSLKLKRLHNALIGDDLAVFEIGPPVKKTKDPADSPPACVDLLPGRPVVDPALDTPFFHTSKYSWPWHIVEHDDGTLEDTLGGTADRTTLKKIEHTAACTSSHQGDHEMMFCDAYVEEGALKLHLHGGMPAYASSLEITVHKDRFNCAFKAVYPSPTSRLKWRITKKELKLKEGTREIGKRLHAWLSVEFEEGSLVDGKLVWRPFKIQTGDRGRMTTANTASLPPFSAP